MKKYEKILKYLDGELTGEELKSFEAEINTSSKLRKEVDSYRNTLKQFKSLENIRVENSYFANILPLFRQRISNRKLRNLRPVFVLSSIAAILITIVLLFLFNSNQIFNGENTAVEEINTDGLNMYLDKYAYDLSTFQLLQDVPEEYDSLFNSLVVEELNLNGNSGDYLVDVTGSEFYDILNELSNDEIEGIYNTLIDKKIY